MKNKIITLRVSEHEYLIIKSNAEKENVTVSRYITGKALSNNNITVHKRQKVYTSLAIIKDCVRENEAAKTIITGECDKIWQVLN